MSVRFQTIRVVALMALCKVLIVDDAQAYVDPGTGSLIFQMALALIVGAGVALRAYWRKIRALFSRGKPDSGHTPTDEPDSTRSS